MSGAAARYLSLDVLRGLTVALMIVVNTPGDWGHVYGPLLHAEWNGFTPTDLVFPTFLFVLGNALAFALPKYAQMGDRAVLAKIGKRAAIIFLLGFLLFWFPFTGPLSEARIPGVLQRIALCFACAALVLHYAGRRAALSFSVLALLGHWLVLAAFGDLTMSGNAGRQLDLWLLGERHLYHGEGIAFDPEGILGTLPATVNVIAGYFAGRLVLSRGAGREALTKMMMAGAALLALALGWSTILPINKKLWTGSYVLLAVGLDLLILPLLIYAIEMHGWRRGTYFFEVFGKNTLFIYLFAELAVIVLDRAGWYQRLHAALLVPLAPAKPASLMFAVAFMLCCWVVAWALDRRRIYIKV
jgi:predicted acyltransferase